ncbi:DUF120 domain-containing protein [Thermococcus atlanticus]
MRKLRLMLLLAKKGAIGEKRKITVRGVAEELGASPQTVLRTLDELEGEGLVLRRVSGRKTYVEISEKGLKFLEELCDEVYDAIYQGIIIGEVISGIGEGAYYVRHYAPLMEEYLGFTPYPGTLNLRVIFPKTIFDALCGAEPITIPGFVREGRTFGDVKAYRVRIDGIEGAIVIPSRTIHPPKIAEVVAPICLREALNLSDGSKVTLRVIK